MFFENQTIVLDIENTLVSRVDVKNPIDLRNIKQLVNFNRDYVVYQSKNKNLNACCQDAGT